MQLYRWRARSMAGKLYQGSYLADSKQEVAAFLHENYDYITGIEDYGFMWAKNHMFLTVGFLALFMLLVFYFPEKRPEPKEREQVKKTKRKKGELRL